MTRYRVSQLSCLLIAYAIAAVPGCGADTERSGATGDDVDQGGVVTSAVTGCTLAQPAGAWINEAFPDQAKMFHADFDATPSTAAIDAVVGLSGGSAADFAQLAAIVRFNPAGTLDVRNGSAYQSTSWPYRAGESLHFRIDIDVRTHSYSVWIGTGPVRTPLAKALQFRSEQAAVASLSSVASKVDSTAGALQVCNVAVVADATTGDGCVVAVVGDSFVNLPTPDATVLDTVEFSVQPDRLDLDAVIGLSAGPADRFSDLAVAVRLAPSGMTDVRDGDGYRADLSHPYGLFPEEVRLIADLTTHTYSVVTGASGLSGELAHQYNFRTEQRAVTHLDHVAVAVDGTQGRLQVCLRQSTPSVGVAYSREGTYTVAPLANGEALISDGATTTRVDAGGHVLATLPFGGELAVDPLGNIFVARIAGTVLFVDKYAPDGAPVWTRGANIGDGARIAAMAADATGPRVGVVTPQARSVSFVDSVSFPGVLTTAGEAIALDGDQFFVATQRGDTLQIARYAATGATVWSREFAGQPKVTQMAADPAHNLVFGGNFGGGVDFGGGPLVTHSNPEGSVGGFVVKLSNTGAHVFSQALHTSEVEGIATNGSRIVVSSIYRTQLHWARLDSFDAGGRAAAYYGSDGFDPGESHGDGRRVWMSPSGRLWWSRSTIWPGAVQAWPYLVTFTE